MAMRPARLAVLLSLVCGGLVATGPGVAQSGGYSAAFLDQVNALCWGDGTEPGDRQPSRAPIRAYLVNAGAEDLSRICAYDLICGEVAFSGRVERRSRVALTICPDSRLRGHLLLLDPFGHLVEHGDLRSPATVELETVGRR